MAFYYDDDIDDEEDDDEDGLLDDDDDGFDQFFDDDDNDDEDEKKDKDDEEDDDGFGDDIGDGYGEEDNPNGEKKNKRKKEEEKESFGEEGEGGDGFLARVKEKINHIKEVADKAKDLKDKGKVIVDTLKNARRYGFPAIITPIACPDCQQLMVPEKPMKILFRTGVGIAVGAVGLPHNFKNDVRFVCMNKACKQSFWATKGFTFSLSDDGKLIRHEMMARIFHVVR